MNILCGKTIKISRSWLTNARCIFQGGVTAQVRSACLAEGVHINEHNILMGKMRQKCSVVAKTKKPQIFQGKIVLEFDKTHTDAGLCEAASWQMAIHSGLHDPRNPGLHDPF